MKNIAFIVLSFGISVTVILFLLFQKIGFFYSLDTRILDQLILSAGKRQPDKKVVIVTIDDDSYEKFGSDEVSLRSQLVKLIRKSPMIGAKTIVVDIFLRDIIDQTVDSLMAHVTDSTKNVIHCITFSEEEPDSACTEGVAYEKYAIKISNQEAITPFYFPDAAFPNKKFVDAFEMVGSVTNECDPDNGERRISLIVEFNGRYYPALALSTLLHYFSAQEKSVRIEKNFWGLKVVIDTPAGFVEIPINSKGQVILNYYGILEVFNPIPLSEMVDLLDSIQKDKSGKTTLPSFKNKIIFIGSSETGIDKHNTPFSPAFPGVGMHATSVSNALQGGFIIEAPWHVNAIAITVLNLLLLGFFFYYLRFPVSLQLFILLSLGIITIFNFFSYFFFFQNIGIWLKFFQINISFIILFVFLLFYEKGVRLKKLDEEITKLDQREKSQTAQLKIVEYFANEVRSILTDYPSKKSEYFGEIFSEFFENEKILKGQIDAEIKELKNKKEKFDQEKTKLKLERDVYKRLVERKKTEKAPPVSSQPGIDKVKIAKSIMADYQFFQSQPNEKLLHLYSTFGILAVPETSYGNGETTLTEMGKIFEEIKKISSYDSTVLITGEHGTGKELVVKAIHKLSKRANRPLVTRNCAAIPENLMESELFGHVKGAYSGATTDRKGAFLTADGGTIFLDEIGELRLDLQPKLLRFIQEKTLKNVGSDKMTHVDVRIISATNKELEKCINNNGFRPDLYYRLMVVNIHLPPLRQRKIDIPFLMQYFLEKLNTKYSEEKVFSNAAIVALMCYNWPGNIRELENVVERAFVNASKNVIGLAVLPDSIQSAYTNIFEDPEFPVWHQIEELILLEMEKLLESCKTAIRNEKTDEFLESLHLKIQPEQLPNCYEYFLAWLKNMAATSAEEDRTWLAQKMTVLMCDKLKEWRNDEKFTDFKSFDMIIKKVLGKERRTINNWKKGLEERGIL